VSARDYPGNVPILDEFADVPAEHKTMFAVVRRIASMDCRYGESMKEIAKAAVLQILEARSDAKVAISSKARIDAILKKVTQS